MGAWLFPIYNWFWGIDYDDFLCYWRNNGR